MAESSRARRRRTLHELEQHELLKHSIGRGLIPQRQRTFSAKINDRQRAKNIEFLPRGAVFVCVNYTSILFVSAY